MAELYPKLVVRFQNSGAGLDISVQQLLLEKRDVVLRKKQVTSEENNNKKKRILKAIVKKIKEVLGFKGDKENAINVVEGNEAHSLGKGKA